MLHRCRELGDNVNDGSTKLIIVHRAEGNREVVLANVKRVKSFGEVFIPWENTFLKCALHLTEHIMSSGFELVIMPNLDIKRKRANPILKYRLILPSDC